MGSPTGAHVSADTGSDAQAVAANARLRLKGVTVVASTSVTLVRLRNGTTSSDPVVATVRCPAATTVHLPIDDDEGIPCPAGIYIDRDTFASEVVVYTNGV